MEIYPIEAYSIEYDSFTGDVYILDTASITLTAGTLTAEQLTSTDDITMLGHLLTMGDNSSAADIVLSFLSSGNDATITYDQTDDEFDFGDAVITTTGELNSGKHTILDDSAISSIIRSSGAMLPLLLLDKASAGTTGASALRQGDGNTTLFIESINGFEVRTDTYANIIAANLGGSSRRWILDGATGNVIGTGSLTGHSALGIDNIAINGNLISSIAGDLNIVPAAGQVITLGITPTDHIEISRAGDMVFKGSAGVPFGHMYVDGTQAIRVALTLNTPAEVKDDGTTSAEDGWLSGDLNLMTFPTGGTEHYITITKPGVYHITWNLSFKMVTGAANTQIHAGLAIDSTTFRRDKCEAHRTISNNTDTGNMGGTCMIDLPNGNEELSLWMENTTNSNDSDVVHGSLTAVMVGGT